MTRFSVLQHLSCLPWSFSTLSMSFLVLVPKNKHMLWVWLCFRQNLSTKEDRRIITSLDLSIDFTDCYRLGFQETDYREGILVGEFCLEWSWDQYSWEEEEGNIMEQKLSHSINRAIIWPHGVVLLSWPSLCWPSWGEKIGLLYHSLCHHLVIGWKSPQKGGHLLGKASSPQLRQSPKGAAS